MMRLWWKSIKWFATFGVMLWFLALPLASVYGLLRPWPQAREELKAKGVEGYPLMIGAGSSGEHRFDSSGERWREEKQRSYVIFPDSFHRMEIFTYSESQGSGITGVRKVVLRTRLLIPFVVLWILAGLFTVWKAFQWSAQKKQNQSPQPIQASSAGPLG